MAKKKAKGRANNAKKTLLRGLIGDCEISMFSSIILSILFGSLWMGLYMYSRSQRLDMVLIRERWMNSTVGFWVIFVGIVSFSMIFMQMVNAILNNANGLTGFVVNPVVRDVGFIFALLGWILGLVWCGKFVSRYNDVMAQTGVYKNYKISGWVWWLFNAYGVMFTIHLKKLPKWMGIGMAILATVAHWTLYAGLYFA